MKSINYHGNLEVFFFINIYEYYYLASVKRVIMNETIKNKTHVNYIKYY